MDEKHILELALQSGTPSGLIIVLWLLLRGWFGRIETRLAALEGGSGKANEKDNELTLEVRDLGRRVALLEGAKAR